MLAPGADGGWHLVDLGGGKDEYDVWRRLLDSLEQCVEGTVGEHVHLVYDIYFVLGVGRGKKHLVLNLPHVVYRCVGGTVYLDNIHGVALGNLLAAGAQAAGVSVGPWVLAVDCLGQDTGGRSLTYAPWPREQISMGNLARRHRFFEAGGHKILPGQLVEYGGSHSCSGYCICHLI